MKKISLLTIVLLSFVASHLQAKTIWQQKNNAANYVKVKKMKDEDALSTPTHPATVSQEEVENYLASLRYSKAMLFRKDVREKRLFNTKAIKKLAPHLVQAFQEVGPFEHVYFSIVIKNPVFIVRNDSVTQGKMWIANNELHIKITKLAAKLTGDYRKRGVQGQRLIARAQGLRTALSVGPGQKLSFDDAAEIILDRNADWPAILQQLDSMDAQIDTKKNRLLSRAKSEGAPRTTYQKNYPAQSTSHSASQVEARLKKLKELRTKGLINQKDYQQKKSDILKSL